MAEVLLEATAHDGKDLLDSSGAAGWLRLVARRLSA
jgi:hypothetical protein